MKGEMEPGRQRATPDWSFAAVAGYATGPIAVVALVWLHGRGLVADTPLWFVLTAVLGSGLINLLTAMFQDRRPDSMVRLQLRVGVAVSLIGLITYSVGWGSVLVVAYALMAVELVRSVGASALRSALCWSLATVAAGEALVVAGVAPTMIDPSLGRAISVGGAVCLVVVLGVMAQIARAAEEAQERVRHDARHDSLTGLLNRAAFAEELERVGDRARHQGHAVGLLFVDLDGFKQVNDQFGHDIGDAVLVQTARRIAAVVRGDEALARLGGDEFAVLLQQVRGVDTAIRVAERILDVVAERLDGLPDDVRVGASIGIAVRSREGIEMSSLLRAADKAMYTAKREGRRRWALSPAGSEERRSSEA